MGVFRDIAAELDYEIVVANKEIIIRIYKASMNVVTSLTAIQDNILQLLENKASRKECMNKKLEIDRRIKALEEINQIKVVAIVICNNDFRDTFTNLLNTLYRAIEHRSFENITKEWIKLFIETSILSHYIGFQKKYYNENWSNYTSNDEETTRYLIECIKIQFDDEAEKSILTLDHDHGSYYLLLKNGEIGSF